MPAPPTPTPPELRVLAPADLRPMRQLLDVFGTAFGEPAADAALRPGDAYLEQLLGSPTFIAIAALEAGEVVGGLAGYVLPKFEQERSEFYIYDLAVAEAHRRRGIATALIQRLRQLCTQRGIYVIFVQADHGDDPAIALYSGLGIREDVLHFDIAPADGAD